MNAEAAEAVEARDEVSGAQLPAREASAAGASAAKKRKARPEAEAGKDTAVAAEAASGGDTPATAGADALPVAKRAKRKKAGVPQTKAAAKASGAAAVGRTVFVDGVPYVWNTAKIEDFFRDCGRIAEVRAPTWQDSGRLRGYAHVTFTDPAGRKKALALNGSTVGKRGRYLKIEAANEPDSTHATPSTDLEGKRRLFVKNLPYDATEAEIAALFLQCGEVREIRVPTSFGRCKGFAYVEFARSESLKTAFELEPPELRGRTLRLDVDSGSGPKGGFHFRAAAYGSGFGPDSGSSRGSRGRRGGRGGRGSKDGGDRLSLF